MGTSESKEKEGLKEKEELKEKEDMIVKLREENKALAMKVDALEVMFNKILLNIVGSFDKYQLDKKTVTLNGKQFKMSEKIGEGGFGVVYKAECSGKAYAIKILSDKEAIKNEVRFLQEVSDKLGPHSPIINIYAFDVVNSEVYIAMEFASGSSRNLFNQIERLNDNHEKLVLSLIVYCFVLKALEFLEAVNIVHGDIKPENFVIIPTKKYPWGFNIKLIDFGTIHVIDSAATALFTTNAVMGVICYMAPERTDKEIHRSADIWSLGVMIYELVYSRLPVEFNTKLKIRKFLTSDDPIELTKDESLLCNVFYSVMRGCLNRNPRARPSAILLLSKAIELIESFKSEESIKAFLVVLLTVLKETHRKEEMLLLIQKNQKKK